MFLSFLDELRAAKIPASLKEHLTLLEALKAGVIGNVTEAHAWTNRPIWPQGHARPQKSDPVTEHLDWDLWLGPAPQRPYVEIGRAPCRERGEISGVAV